MTGMAMITMVIDGYRCMRRRLRRSIVRESRAA
jgi:hypothetical protein